MNDKKTKEKSKIKDNEVEKTLSFFEKYLSIWVAIAIIIGISLGKLIPTIPTTLSKIQYANVNIPISILIWAMIYPMMVEIDFESILEVKESPRGLLITWITNWIIKPFSMYLIFYIFMTKIFNNFISVPLQNQYLAGAVLLGAAPCTAMVFVWSYLSDGDPAYTLVQVSSNDLILLVAYVPIVTFLLGIGGIKVPYDTLILSVILFVVIPLTTGYISRRYLLKKKGKKWFENVFLEKLNDITIISLILTLILIFSFQGDVILKNPIHIILIAIPLTIQTFFIFTIAYGWSYIWNLKHQIAAPASMIGASNFFELSVAVAISVFGISSGAALATVVGVLVEVPLMLTLVNIANRTKKHFKT